MDAEDFDDIELYWDLLCEHQDLCRTCYAPNHEHGKAENGNLICPE